MLMHLLVLIDYTAKHLQFPVIALWMKCFLQSGELFFFLKDVFVYIYCISYFSKICFLILF